MMSKATLPVLACLLLATAVSPWSPADASIVAESDTHYWCSESGRETLPKKLTMIQAIDDRFFASAPFVSVEVFATYRFRIDVNSGKVVVTGVVIKTDGTEMKLPRLVGRMRLGDATQSKSTNLVIERGDIIEWRVKLKGLAPLRGVMDCLSVEVAVVGSERGTFQGGHVALSGALKSKM